MSIFSVVIFERVRTCMLTGDGLHECVDVDTRNTTWVALNSNDGVEIVVPLRLL